MGFDLKRMDIYRKVPKDLTQVMFFRTVWYKYESGSWKQKMCF